MSKKNRQRGRRTSPGPEVSMDFTLEEVDVLRRVARYYERNFGVTRFLVYVTAPRDVKEKYRFVREESFWLQRLADVSRDSLTKQESSAVSIRLTLPALIAYWGRILASLNSKRSRRKLSSSEIERRTALAARLADAAAGIHRTDSSAVDAALETRRDVEAAWMQEQLGITSKNPSSDADRTPQ